MGRRYGENQARNPSRTGAVRDSLGALALSHGGAILAAGAANANATEIALPDVPTGAVKRVLKGHTQGITGLAFSPDDKTLASTSRDSTPKIWDLTAPPKR